MQKINVNKDVNNITIEYYSLLLETDPNQAGRTQTYRHYD